MQIIAGILLALVVRISKDCIEATGESYDAIVLLETPAVVFSRLMLADIVDALKSQT